MDKQADSNMTERNGNTDPADSPRRKPIFSEDLLDNERIIAALDIHLGHIILDAGCGNGYMSQLFVTRVGDKGKVYALDIDKESVRILNESSIGTNIEALEADITTTVPLNSSTLNLIYLSTVFHIFSKAQISVFQREVRRLLKPGGVLAIVEIEKKETPFGPPLSNRWSPRELRGVITLSPKKLLEAGPYFYMQLFEKK
jgi:ubiquinone/menaquinone biosynthesis C-methylase UbiE